MSSPASTDLRVSTNDKKVMPLLNNSPLLLASKSKSVSSILAIGTDSSLNKASGPVAALMATSPYTPALPIQPQPNQLVSKMGDFVSGLLGLSVGSSDQSREILMHSEEFAKNVVDDDDNNNNNNNNNNQNESVDASNESKLLSAPTTPARVRSITKSTTTAITGSPNGGNMKTPGTSSSSLLSAAKDLSYSPLSPNAQQQQQHHQHNVLETPEEQLQHEHEDQEDNEAMLRGDVNKLIPALERVRRQRDAIRGDLSRYVARVHIVTEEFAHLREKLIGSEAAVRMLHKKLAATENEASVLRERDAALHANAPRPGADAEEHATATSRLAAEVARMKDQLAELHRSLDAAAKEKKGLEIQLHRQEEKIIQVTQVSHEHEVKEAALDTILQAERRAHKEALDALTTEHAKSMQEAASHQADLLAELQQVKEHQKEQVTALLSAQETLLQQATLAAAEKLAKAEASSSQVLARQDAQRLRAIEMTKQELEDTKRLNASLEKRCKDLEAQAVSLGTRLLESEKQAEAAMLQVRDMSNDASVSIRKGAELLASANAEKERAVADAVRQATSEWVLRAEASREDLRAALARLASMEAEAAVSITSLAKEVALREATEASLTSLRTRLHAEVERASSAETNLSAAMHSAALLRIENDKLRAASAIVPELKEEIIALQAALVRAGAETSSVRTEGVNTRQRIASLHADVGQVREALASSEARADRLYEDLRRERAHAEIHAEALRKASSERDDAISAQEKLNAEITVLRTRLADSATEAAQLRIASVSIPAQTAESIRTLRVSLADASDQLNEARAAMENLRMQNDKLSSTAATADARVHDAMVTALRIGEEREAREARATAMAAVNAGGGGGGGESRTLFSNMTYAPQAPAPQPPASRVLFPEHSPNKYPNRENHDDDAAHADAAMFEKEARLQLLIAQQNAAMSSLLKQRDALSKKLAIANQELSVYRRVDVYSMTLRASVESTIGRKDVLEGRTV